MKVNHSVIILLTAILLINYPVFPQDKFTNEGSDLELEALLDVKVTVASKKPENISDAPGVIYVLTRDELERTGATTLREVLLRVPSMGISTTALTSRSLLVMRGDNIKINSGHILFLLNGHPIREVQESGINADFYESFPVNIVEQVEVIRGPGSVLYGSDAFSGVINIKTRQPTDEKFTSSITGHYLPETGGGVMGDMLVKTGDLNLVAAARYYQKPNWNKEYRHVYWDFNNLAAGQMDSIVDDDVIFDQGPGIFFDAKYKDLSSSASFVQWKSSAFQNKCNVTLIKFFGNVGYKTAISDNWRTDINFTGTRTGLNTENPNFVKRRSNNLLLENTHFISILKSFDMVVGGTTSYIEGYEKGTDDIEYKDPLFITSEGNRWAFSGYSQIDYMPIDNVKLIGGIQANKTRGMKLNYTPRMGGIWHPTDQISVKSFYSRAFRLPSINELYQNYVIGLFGDRNLKPEIVTTFDQGISFQNDRFMLGINYFHSKMHDIIQQASYPQAAAFWYKKYQNLGDVTFIGGEVEGKWYITNKLYVNGSMLYQNNHDSVYSTVPFPDFIAKGGVSYTHAQGITLTLFNCYQGHTSGKFHGRVNNDEQSSFNMLNFSSKFEINRLLNFESRLAPSFLFKIDNIIGHEQFMWEYGGFNNEAIPTLRGREFYLGLTLTM